MVTKHLIGQALKERIGITGNQILEAILIVTVFVVFAMQAGCAKTGAFTTGTNKAVIDAHPEIYTPDPTASFKTDAEYMYGKVYVGGVWCFNGSNLTASAGGMGGGFTREMVKATGKNLIKTSYASNGMAITITDSSDFVVDETNKTVTETNSVTSGGSIAMTMTLFPTAGSKTLNVGTSFAVNFTDGQTILTRTKKYQLFKALSYNSTNGWAYDYGYYLEEPSITIPSDSGSVCYRVYSH